MCMRQEEQLVYKVPCTVAKQAGTMVQQLVAAAIDELKKGLLEVAKLVELGPLLQSDEYTFMKKTVVSVDLLCSKCRLKVMKLISTIEGINSIVLDPSKNTVTVVGEADPVCIIKKVRKFRRSAQIVSVGPPKDDKKDEKKDTQSAAVSLPRTCPTCDVWYEINYDPFNYCSIL